MFGDYMILYEIIQIFLVDDLLGDRTTYTNILGRIPVI